MEEKIVRKVGRPRLAKRIPKITGEPSSFNHNYIHAVGRRKSAIARLRLLPKGRGAFVINDKPYDEYFRYQLWRDTILNPLTHVGKDGVYDISVKISGGGLSSQSEAIRLALCRALLRINDELRPTLRKMGWLTRDAREKERKKPGLKRARRAPQWQKR